LAFCKSALAGIFVLGMAVSPTNGEEPSAEPADPLAFLEKPLAFSDWIEGEFTKAGDHGVTPFFNYWATWQGNPVGGLSQSTAYAQETLFGVSLDMEKLTGWRGASFRVSGSANAGKNLSQAMGNVFNASQAYVVPTILFYEAYYAQKFGAFEFRIGRLSPSDWFASLPAFGMQVQGGIDGNPTSLYLNSKFISSPNATWGGALKASPTKDTYAAYGIYQATDRLGLIAYHGLDFSVRPGDAVFMMAETGWEPTLAARESRTLHDKSGKKTVVPSDPGLPGQYKFGGYFSTFPQPDANGGAEQNTLGFYLMAQQMVWRSERNPDINFSLWAGATYSPQYEVAQMPWMGFGGTIFQGVIPGRPQDQFLCTWMTGGFGPAFSTAPGQESGHPYAETVFDVSYIINLTEELFVQPDIQYILNPNGTTTPNALVLGLQFGCNF